MSDCPTAAAPAGSPTAASGRPTSGAKRHPSCPDDLTLAPLGIQIVFLGHVVANVIERRLMRQHYNHTQAAILMLLNRRDEQVALDLSEEIKVEPPSITRALQSLERRNLVGRRPHPTDGRSSLFCLTDAGREAIGAIEALMQSISAELFGEMETEDLAAFRGVLARTFARVERIRRGES